MPPVNVSVSLRQAVFALGLANLRYWSTVAGQVRRELRGWERRAREIADPVLRGHAVAKLEQEHFNAEVAATLATLAPRRHRKHVIAATVAFQVMYDYLDAVGEQPVADPLRNGRHLYAAFTNALGDTAAAQGGYYLHHPQEDDGGYLEALVAVCGTAFSSLPSAATVVPVARRTAARCGEAQTRTHALPREGVTQLAAWAAAEGEGTELTWWEIAAGAAASVLSVHALIAAAADPCTTRCEAARIDAAYLPISALTTLLDSVVDREHDLLDGGHGYVTYYASSHEAAERIRTVARHSTSAAASLPHAGHHVMTVAGAAAYYLSGVEAGTNFARPIAARVIPELRPLILPILGIFRVWRLAKRLRLQLRRGGHVAALEQIGAVVGSER